MSSSVFASTRPEQRNLAMRTISFFRRELRKGGLIRVASVILSRSPIHVFTNVILLYTEARLAIPMGKPPLDVVLSIACEADLVEVAACYDDSQSQISRRAALFRQFLAEGHVCIFARLHNKIVAHQWIFFNRYTITVDEYCRTRLTLALDSKSAFFGNAFVKPEFRGHKIIIHLKLFGLRQFPQVQTVYTSINSLNDSSLKSSSAFGFVPIAVIRFTAPLTLIRTSLRAASSGAWTHFGRNMPTLALRGRFCVPG